MSKTRQKINLSWTIEDRDGAELIVGEIAVLTINQLKATATMDAQIAAVRSRYETDLSAMAEQLKENTDALCAWAEANPDQFPKGQKSIKFTQGTIGFRTGTPKVTLLSRLWNWKKVLEAIVGFGLGRDFIRNNPEVDKDAILAHHAKAKDKDAYVDKVLKPIGVKIVQDESFYVEPLITEVDVRQTTEAA